MSNNVPTTHTARLTLANGFPVTIRMTWGAERDPEAVPLDALPGEILLAVDGDVASAADIGQAMLDLLYAGEAAQQASARAGTALDATVAAVEAARATGRDW
ncbi:MAG TPA: hypothetical protein VFR74_14720 [Jiangellales bacterium]|nr:hypothetical protein [Jiangellales bacterium]